MQVSSEAVGSSGCESPCLDTGNCTQGSPELFLQLSVLCLDHSGYDELLLLDSTQQQLMLLNTNSEYSTLAEKSI